MRVDDDNKQTALDSPYAELGTKRYPTRYVLYNHLQSCHGGREQVHFLVPYTGKCCIILW